MKKSFFNEKKQSPYYIAGFSLFTSMSFRLNKKDTQDSLVFIRNLKRVFSSCTSKIIYKTFDSNSGILLLASTDNNIGIRKIHAEKLTSSNVQVIVTRSELLTYTNFLNYIKNVCLSIVVFTDVLFNKKKYQSRSNAALLIRELPEINNLLYVIKKHDIKQILDYGCYEVDSNFLYLILNNMGIKVVKIPPPGPLYIHNKNLIADELVISSQYQNEELYGFEDTIKYSTIRHFYPEFYNFSKIGAKKNESENCFVFGFYSHASWLRELKNDADNGLNLFQAEEYLLSMINKVFSENHGYKLMVFLHPKERVDMKTTSDYYSNILRDVSFEFSPPNCPSADCFHLCNIALTSLSTILFERLFAGYKVLICKEYIVNFPSKSSALNSISFSKEDELIYLIEKNLKLSDAQYQEMNGVKNYCEDSFIILR